MLFFGGRHWKHVFGDLAKVPRQDFPHFILSLFMIVLTDQCLYTYQRDMYKLWREKTNYPKFGWSGFGPHNENPFMLLWIPEKEKIIDPDYLNKFMAEFVKFMVNETICFLKENLPTLEPNQFFNCIKQDSAYSFHTGQTVECFKREFEKETASC